LYGFSGYGTQNETKYDKGRIENTSTTFIFVEQKQSTMRQVTLQIPENQYAFFMELVKKLKFAKIASTPTKKLDKEQQEWVDGLKESLNEVELHMQGKIQLQDARDFLNEL
jgi:hypothetical protein